MLTLRRGSATLRSGGFELLDTGHEDVIAYRRTAAATDTALEVAANFADEPREVRLAGGSAELVASSLHHRDHPGTPFDGRLGPREAVVVRAR